MPKASKHQQTVTVYSESVSLLSDQSIHSLIWIKLIVWLQRDNPPSLPPFSDKAKSKRESLFLLVALLSSHSVHPNDSFHVSFLFDNKFWLTHWGFKQKPRFQKWFEAVRVAALAAKRSSRGFKSTLMTRSLLSLQWCQLLIKQLNETWYERIHHLLNQWLWIWRSCQQPRGFVLEVAKDSPEFDGSRLIRHPGHILMQVLKQGDA